MATFYFTNDSYELQHHGILGMKWGVRRYQNEDGSLTEAGKKRAGRLNKVFGKDSPLYPAKNSLISVGHKKSKEIQTAEKEMNEYSKKQSTIKDMGNVLINREKSPLYSAARAAGKDYIEAYLRANFGLTSILTTTAQLALEKGASTVYSMMGINSSFLNDITSRAIGYGLTNNAQAAYYNSLKNKNKKYK